MLHVQASGDASSATFTLHNEDHTMGNTLRYMLNKTPSVSFVGYSVPHPAEAKMNLRLQKSFLVSTSRKLDSFAMTSFAGEMSLAWWDHGSWRGCGLDTCSIPHYSALW